MNFYNLRHFARLGKNVFFEGYNGWGREHENLLWRQIIWFGRNSFVGGNKGRIKIGNNVHLAYGVIIISYDSINIGDDVLIGEYTSIRDHDHNFKKGKLIREQELTTSPIVIEKNVWIGRGCTILKGVTIKTGSVIGANSLVNDDIPEYSVAAGTPAKIIKKIN